MAGGEATGGKWTLGGVRGLISVMVIVIEILTRRGKLTKETAGRGTQS